MKRILERIENESDSETSSETESYEENEREEVTHFHESLQIFLMGGTAIEVSKIIEFQK